jgi:hypothetical protein
MGNEKISGKNTDKASNEAKKEHWERLGSDVDSVHGLS